MVSYPETTLFLVHYLSDVLAASAAGITWLALCLVAVNTLWYRRGRREHRGRRAYDINNTCSIDRPRAGD